MVFIVALRTFVFAVCVALLACSHAPYQLLDEHRIRNSAWVFLSPDAIGQSSLTTDGESLFIGTRKGRLIAMSARTGRVRWRKDLEARIDARALVSDGVIYVGTASGTFYALSSKEGRELWHQEVGGEILGEPVLDSTARVLFGANDGFLYALDRSTGEIKWRYRAPVPERITIRGFARPVVSSGKVYAGFADGSLAALRLEDGGAIWRKSPTTAARFPDVVAPIVTSKGGLVVAQFAGTLATFTTEGVPRWSIERGGSAAAPIESEGRMIVGTGDSQVVALDLESGTRVWAFDPKRAASWSGLAQDRGRLLAATYQGQLYVIDASGGKLLWTYQFDTPVTGPPVVAAERVWVLTTRGELFGFRPDA